MSAIGQGAKWYTDIINSGGVDLNLVRSNGFHLILSRDCSNLPPDVASWWYLVVFGISSYAVQLATPYGGTLSIYYRKITSGSSSDLRWSDWAILFNS